MSHRFTKNCLLLIILSGLLLPAVNTYAAETTRVNVSSAGQEANDDFPDSISNPNISADGRFVTFTSTASNLVADDTNTAKDVFVHDRQTGETTLVSINSTGEQGNSLSTSSKLSANGRFVAFSSLASNLVPDDNNDAADVFVHDRTTGTTTLVSVNSAGEQGNAGSSMSDISPDGRFVVLLSNSTNLAAGDPDGQSDVFVHDRSTGTTSLISSRPTQGRSNGSINGTISADGRFVAFSSLRNNLVKGDVNNYGDVFVHDRTTGITTLVSVNSAGEQGNSSSSFPQISADGRLVVFSSIATNLVPDDTNGFTDVFVRDLIAGVTSRVSVNPSGGQANDISIYSQISADGRFVAFGSYASNLVPDDNNERADVFVRNLTTGINTRVSVDSAGQETIDINAARQPSISADGRFVAFKSHADSLVAGDTNDLDDVFVHDRLLNSNKTADLQLTVASQSSSVQTGQLASYTYTLTNNGPGSIATATKLISAVANGTVVSLTPSQGSCTKAAVSVCSFSSLTAGASATLTVSIEAGSDPLTQYISVNAPPVDDAPDNNSIIVSTPVTP